MMKIAEIAEIVKIENFKDMKLNHKATSKNKSDLRDSVMLYVFNFQTLDISSFYGYFH